MPRFILPSLALTLVLGSCTGGGATGDHRATTPDSSLITTAPATTSVWAVLSRQPLHFPSVAVGAACPVTPPSGLPPNHRFSRSTWKDWTGGNPVFEFGLGSVHYTTSVGGPTEGWYPWKVLWFATPGYEGPILIRGRQLDGANEIRFNGKISTDPARTEIHQTVPGQNRVWATNLFFRGPGCYAVQMDGLGFTKVVVFHAGP